jgi:hypothetical protein
MTEPSVSFAGNLTDQPDLRYTESGIARAMFRAGPRRSLVMRPMSGSLRTTRRPRPEQKQGIPLRGRVV